MKAGTQACSVEASLLPEDMMLAILRNLSVLCFDKWRLTRKGGLPNQQDLETCHMTKGASGERDSTLASLCSSCVTLDKSALTCALPPPPTSQVSHKLKMALNKLYTPELLILLPLLPECWEY